MKRVLFIVLGVIMTMSSFANGHSEKEQTVLNSKEKAVNILESFSTGDTKSLSSLVAEDYIEHNLGREDGLDGLKKSISTMIEKELEITVHRVLEDGDFVILHSEYSYIDEQYAGFDVFRFENGLAVEHWDNFEAIAKPNPSGRTQLDGPVEVWDLDLTEKNKEITENSVHALLLQEHPERMYDYFDGNNYLQHNFLGADGVDTMVKGMKYLAENGLSSKYLKVHYILGEGDFVLTISEVEKLGKLHAYYDLFRIENEKIAEHWDIHEMIPEENQWLNSNGKF